MLIQRVQKNFKIYVAFCQQFPDYDISCERNSNLSEAISRIGDTVTYIHISQEVHVGIPSVCPTEGQMWENFHFVFLLMLVCTFSLLSRFFFCILFSHFFFFAFARLALSIFILFKDYFQCYKEIECV